jgi:hypothetical protein
VNHTRRGDALLDCFAYLGTKGLRMELTISETKAKELLKEVIIELAQERRDLFFEIILEAIEEIGLANAIRQGRQNEFVSEESIVAILEGQAWE